MMTHLGDWTAYWAQRTPLAPALFEPQTGRTWSYLELDRRANKLAQALRQRNIARGDRVAVLAHNCGAHFELFFACAKLGAFFAPLNWRLAPNEIDAILSDAEAKVLFFDRACQETVSQLGWRAPRVALHRDYENLIESGSEADLAAFDLSLDDPVMLCYTSGTTGLPKGALLSHRQLLFNSLSTQLAIGLSPSDSTLVFMPLFHTGGFNCLATPILHHGGRVVVMPAFDAQETLRLIESERITLQMGVPTIYDMIARAPSFATRDLSSTRMAICGGAACPLELIERYRQRGILFRQGYGLTEVGPNCFSLTPEDAFRKAGSVGWPNFYLSTRIVRDDGALAAPGEPGELQLSGPMVTLGYFRNPDATAQAFDGKWFRTGDTFTRDAEGYHYVVGRKKEMFISGGENVYPAEVELAIAELPGVKEVCVFGVHDPVWGEVGRAVIVPVPGAQLAPDAVTAQLRGRLAKYKIPKSVVFADSIPRNPGGKIVRAEVKERFGIQR